MKPSTFAKFHPRLLDHWRGYNRSSLLRDTGAGFTVGIVALPLAMAFAIASGLRPEAGLWTAIVGGLLVSLLGGSSVQIGGPAGAFIVIVYGIVERHGLGGLLIATTSAGVLLFLMGWLRLGNLVRYVPVSLVIGFTNGIAVLIALSQMRDLLGLQVDKMPADFFHQISTLYQHIHTLNRYSLGLGILCVLGLWAWPRLWANDSGFAQKIDAIQGASALRATSRLPAPVVALVTLTLAAWLLRLPVETIGSRFGGIPQGLPDFQLPAFSWESAKQLVTPTLTIAALGAIESLLCARVADQFGQGRKHDPNQELMAQGVANFAVPFVGGMPVTGTIARTVTNVRAGAVSPMAGVIHALALMLIILLAAPLASHVPLAVLAGILLFVAWNMGEWREFARLRQFSPHYRLLLLSTFVVTVVFDLTLAVELGLLLACLLFVKRQGALFSAELVSRTERLLTYRLYGSLFFGAVTKIDPILAEVEAGPDGRDVVLDATRLVALDTTGLDALEQLIEALERRGGHLDMVQLNEQPMDLLRRSGLLTRLRKCS